MIKLELKIENKINKLMQELKASTIALGVTLGKELEQYCDCGIVWTYDAKTGKLYKRLRRGDEFFSASEMFEKCRKCSKIFCPVRFSIARELRRQEIEKLKHENEHEMMISYRDIDNYYNVFAFPKDKKFDKYEFDMQLKNQKRPGKNSKKKESLGEAQI